MNFITSETHDCNFLQQISHPPPGLLKQEFLSKSGSRFCGNKKGGRAFENIRRRLTVRI